MMFNKLFKRKELQSVVYIVTQCIVFGLAFAINVIITNFCENSEVYGQYKYATNFILTIPAMLSLGINWSCATLVAKEKEKNKDGIITASIVCTIILSITITIVLFFGFLVLPYLGCHILSDINVIIPFVIIFMLQNLINQIYSGQGQAYQLALFSLIPNIFITIGMIIIIKIFGGINYSQAIIIYLLGYTISILPKLIKIKYKFSDFKSSVRTLVANIKESGIKVYISTIFTTSATQIIALFCGKIYGYSEYGYFSLAASLAIVFQLIGSTVAVVNFKKYTNSDRIEKKDFLFTIILGVSSYLFMNLAISIVFFWFYPKEYAPTIFYLRLLCLSNMIFGFSMLFNRFFIGKDLGSIVMKNSLIVALINIITSIPLIFMFKLQGLVISSLIVSVSSNVVYYIDYKKLIKKIEIDTKEMIHECKN